MGTEQFTENFWYSAQYESGFSIIFQVVEIENGSPTFCRKDGVFIDSLPEGYQKIHSHGITEPEYQ